MAGWRIDGDSRTFKTLNAAKRAAQKKYTMRLLVWSLLQCGPMGRKYVVGGTGVETDDKVTIRQTK